MIDVTLAASRPLGTAHILVGEGVSEATLREQLVVLTGEAATLRSPNGRWCFLGALRLLVRVVGNLEVVLPPGFPELEREVEIVCATGFVYASPKFRVGASRDISRAAAAVLNVGSAMDESRPWTSINAQGWVARVSSGLQPLPAAVNQPNPMAALLAASLGVAEVFKRVIGIPSDRAPLFGQIEFSLFEQSTEFSDHGPALPEHLQLPSALLVGAGAIGNAIAWLLSQLPLHGYLHVIDNQAYGDENLGTCMLLEREGWIGADKAERIAQWLSSHASLNVTWERALIRDALAKAQVRAMAPTLVIAGLDNVPARHDVQLAWPELLFDGGISEVGAAVTQYRLAAPDRACLRCAFELPGVDHLQWQQAHTGLAPDVLNDPEVLLSEAHVHAAAPEKQAWLREQLQAGKNICSVISEAALSALGVDAQAGFRPSVPFVATVASALVVAEMVKALQFDGIEFAQTFTIGNVFLGPQSALQLNRLARPSCVCTARRPQILAARAADQREREVH